MSRSQSIATRARRFTIASALISLAVAFGIFYFAWQSFVIDQRTDELVRQVSALSRGLEAGDALETRDPSGIGETTEALSLRERLLKVQAGLIGATLLETDNRGTVQRATSGDVVPGERTIDIAALEATDIEGVRASVRDSETGRVTIVAAPLESGGWLVAAQPLREIVQAQRAIPGLLAASLAIALAIAFVTGTLFSRRLTAPLLRLGDAVQAVSKGDWGHQVDVEGDDEVAALAESFNAMSKRVAQAHEAQKAFVGDVSHELRTPITSIRGWSEALLDGTVTKAEEVERSLTVIADEARRLADLTSALLALSDLDAGATVFESKPIDVEELLAALELRHVHRTTKQNVALDVDRSVDGCQPIGDQERLLQAATVLVDNAMAYTPPGGRVRVRTACADNAWLLTVDDTGPGIPEESSEIVFDRFTRLDSSRSSQDGGSGLGLPMCRRLVEAMGGTVTLSTSDLGGACFAIRMPQG